MARKTLLDLDPKIGKAIIDAVGLGLPDSIACESAGLSLSAFYAWIEKGTDASARPASDTRGFRAARKARSPYKEFAEGLTRARAGFTVNHVKLITRAAQGSVTTSTTTHPDGRVEVRSEQAGDGDWRASKWLLSVRMPADFSERHIVEQRHTNGTGAGPVVIATDAVRVAASVASMTPDQLRALTGTGTDDLAPDPEEEDGGER